MNYYLYKITNQVNGKIYVGVHKTRDMNDGYMGSGKVILNAIKKHGINNFAKVILETFKTSDAMYAREKEVVTEEFLSRKDVYNIRRGGFGGFDYINKTGKNLYGKNGMIGYGQENLKDGASRKKAMIKKGIFNNFKDRIRQSCLQSYKDGRIPAFLDKKHTQKTKQLIGEKNSKKQQGEKNSQFGTMWINNGLISKKINKQHFIPHDWYKGRI